MERKFPKIHYDLSQNFLLYKKLQRLDYFSLILCSSYYMKKLNIFEELEEIDFGLEDILSDKKVIGVIDNLVRKIRMMIFVDLEELDLKVELPETYLKSTISSVLEQTISFLKVTKVYLLKEQQLFVKNLVFTSRTTVNTKKTLIQVVVTENLQIYRKFRLAAHFFLGEQIVRYYYSKLTRKEKDSLSNVDIDDDFGCYYWVWQIRGSRAPIKNFFVYYFDIIKREVECSRFDSKLAIQNIFHRAVKQYNEIAVQYLWNNHVSGVNERELILNHSITKYMAKGSHINIVMFLIFQTGKEELIGFFHSDKHKYMLLFYNNKRWIARFFDVLKILCVNFTGQDYFNILQHIATTNRNKKFNEIYFNFLEIFLRKIPMDKKNMLGNYDDSFKVYYDLLRVAFHTSNEPMVANILAYCEGKQILKFFLSNYGMNLLKISIKKCCYKFIKDILDEFLTEHETWKVKLKFFKCKSFEVCCAFLHVGINAMMTYINWISDSVSFEEAASFKVQLIFMNSGRFVKDLLFSLNFSTIKLFSYADRILIWCVGQEVIDRAKSSISLTTKEEESLQRPIIKCYDNVSKLVLESEWNFLKKLIRWKKCTIGEKRKLGRKLLMDSSLYKQMLKKYNCLNYFYELTDFVIKDLYIKEKDSNLKKFKSEVFKIIVFFLSPLIIDWDLDGVKKAIIWTNVPVRKVRGFREDIYNKLRAFKPKTEDAQRKFKKFCKWFKTWYISTKKKSQSRQYIQ